MSSRCESRLTHLFSQLHSHQGKLLDGGSLQDVQSHARKEAWQRAECDRALVPVEILDDCMDGKGNAYEAGMLRGTCLPL